MKKKRDCVRLKRLGAEKIYQQLRVMTREQQLAFWQAYTLDLRQRQERLKTK
jgi:hypothetical protein